MEFGSDKRKNFLTSTCQISLRNISETYTKNRNNNEIACIFWLSKQNKKTKRVKLCVLTLFHQACGSQVNVPDCLVSRIS